MALRLILALGCLALGVGARAAPLGDPTRPPEVQAEVVGAGAAGAGRVETILIAPDRRLAVIGGRIVRVGDEIGGARVVRIREGGVTLRRDGVTEELPLFQGVEKKLRPRAIRQEAK
ncbi:MAG: hypothetical protein AB1773_00800 [Pseudomonadota bacterium]|jgi:MSHA biogenesis protein MshK